MSPICGPIGIFTRICPGISIGNRVGTGIGSGILGGGTPSGKRSGSVCDGGGVATTTSRGALSVIIRPLRAPTTFSNSKSSSACSSPRSEISVKRSAIIPKPPRIPSPLRKIARPIEKTGSFAATPPGKPPKGGLVVPPAPGNGNVLGGGTVGCGGVRGTGTGTARRGPAPRSGATRPAEPRDVSPGKNSQPKLRSPPVPIRIRKPIGIIVSAFSEVWPCDASPLRSLSPFGLASALQRSCVACA